MQQAEIPQSDPPPEPAPRSRAEQSRINGAKSRGPVSEAGKARSARNPARHGFTPASGLVIGGESARELHAVHQDLLNTWCPDCSDGALLVQRLAVAYLQRDRADRFLHQLDQERLTGPEHRRMMTLGQRSASIAFREVRYCRDALLQLRRHPHQGILITGDQLETIPTEHAADHAPAAVDELPEPAPENSVFEPESSADINHLTNSRTRAEPETAETGPPELDDQEFQDMLAQDRQELGERFLRQMRAELRARRGPG